VSVFPYVHSHLPKDLTDQFQRHGCPALPHSYDVSYA